VPVILPPLDSHPPLPPRLAGTYIGGVLGPFGVVFEETMYCLVVVPPSAPESYRLWLLPARPPEYRLETLLALLCFRS
jgi:hypothetical protein